MAYCLWQGPTHIARSNSEVVRSCLELFGVPRSNSVAVSCSPYRGLFIFTRSCSELLGVHRSNSVVASCSPLVTGTYSYLLGAARSCSELLGATLSLPVASPMGTYSYLLAAARSYSEFIGVPRSNSVVARCSPLVTGTYSYLLGAARSCSELLGATLSLQVASPTGTYRYSYLLAANRSCSEQKCLSNQSHSKCTNGTVYKVKTSKLGNIVKPGQRLEKLFLTREGNCSLLSRMLFS